jgi:hypothetical protein
MHISQLATKLKGCKELAFFFGVNMIAVYSSFSGKRGLNRTLNEAGSRSYGNIESPLYAALELKGMGRLP